MQVEYDAPVMSAAPLPDVDRVAKAEQRASEAEARVASMNVDLESASKAAQRAAAAEQRAWEAEALVARMKAELDAAQAEAVSALDEACTKGSGYGFRVRG